MVSGVNVCTPGWSYTELKPLRLWCHMSRYELITVALKCLGCSLALPNIILLDRFKACSFFLFFFVLSVKFLVNWLYLYFSIFSVRQRRVRWKLTRWHFFTRFLSLSFYCFYMIVFFIINTHHAFKKKHFQLFMQHISLFYCKHWVCKLCVFKLLACICDLVKSSLSVQFDSIYTAPNHNNASRCFVL